MRLPLGIQAGPALPLLCFWWPLIYHSLSLQLGANSPSWLLLLVNFVQLADLVSWLLVLTLLVYSCIILRHALISLFLKGVQLSNQHKTGLQKKVWRAVSTGSAGKRKRGELTICHPWSCGLKGKEQCLSVYSFRTTVVLYGVEEEEGKADWANLYNTCFRGSGFYGQIQWGALRGDCVMLVREPAWRASDESCTGAQSILSLGGASRKLQLCTRELASLLEGTADAARPLANEAS